jgi:predicted chitinase
MADENIFSDFEMLTPQEMELHAEMTEGGTQDPPETITDPVETGEPAEPESFLLSPKEMHNQNPKGDVSSEGNDVNPDSTVLSAFAKTLAEQGLIDLGEDNKIESSKDLVDLADKAISSRAEKFLEDWKKSLAPEQQKALGLIQEGIFNNDTLSYTEKLEKYNNIDMSTDDIDLKKQVVTDYYKANGLTEEKAAKIAQKMVESDDIDEEFRSSVDSLKQTYKSKIADIKKSQEAKRLADEETNKSQFNNLMKSIDEAEYIVDGLPLTKAQKEKLKSSFVEPAGKDENGRPLSAVQVQRQRNPLAFEKALHYYTMLGLFNTDEKGNFIPDLSQIKTVATTKVTNELDRLLQNDANKPLTGGTKVMDKDKQQSLLSSLEKAFSNK